MSNQFNKTSTSQTVARIILGSFLLIAGVGHLTFSRVAFQAQVPPWVPLDVDLVVVLSGIVEILLALSLLFLTKYRYQMGWILAVFFVLVFPGNIAQLTQHRAAFGLDTDLKRWLRLPLQPVLIFVALWSTGAWNEWRKKSKDH